jgi:hypothetical protein
MQAAALFAAVEEPFPGLRSFEPEEALLFFGREQHTEQLLRNLATSRFCAILGSSGSGKSSLAKAGLLPALFRGYLVGSTTHWRVAVMRPGSAPLANLNQALSDAGALGLQGISPDDRLALLSASSMGLVEAVRNADLKPGESLLLLVDQFEEIFRYRRLAPEDDGGAEAGLFVSLLLTAADRFESPIYIVLTMRSEFLGDCTQFAGLPEALSRSQYLIPRLTRDERRQAIERPLQLAGASISAPLLQQLLNDSADDPRPPSDYTRGGSPDPLPILQHALMRTFRHWKQAGANGSVDLADYEEEGRLAALNAHAESVYNELDSAAQRWTQKIFRALTSTEYGRPVRRPTRLDRLYGVCGAVSDSDREQVNAVLNVFLKRENSLLVSSSPGLPLGFETGALTEAPGSEQAGGKRLRDDAVIDIPHESLIWKWERLQGWVRQEAISADWYLDLVSDAVSYRKREAGLWRDPNLSYALRLAKSDGWNQDWAAHTAPSAESDFAETSAFLERSRKAQRNERRLRRAGVALLLIALATTVYSLYRQRELTSQLAQIRSERLGVEDQIRRYQNALNELNAPSAPLSPDDKARREQQIRELRRKIESTQEQALRLYSQELMALRGHAAGISRVAFSPDGKLLATGSDDKTAKLWNSSSGKIVSTLEGHNDNVYGVAFSPDGRRLATGSADKTARTWEIATGKRLSTMNGHTGSVYTVAFSSDGRRIATSSEDQTARIWDSASGALLQTLTGHTGNSYSAVFSPDGRLVATGSDDKTAKIWESRTGSLLRTITGHTDKVIGVVFSPDGRNVATASWDQSIRIWDAASGRLRQTLRGHHGNVYFIEYSPSGRRLASSGADDTIRIWDLATGRELLSIKDKGKLGAFAFHPDGTRLAASFENSVKLYDLRDR